MATARNQSSDAPPPLAAAGAMALVALCCGGHALALGTLGGIALGNVLGIAAGLLAAMVTTATLIAIRRCRAARDRVEADRSAGT